MKLTETGIRSPNFDISLMELTEPEQKIDLIRHATENAFAELGKLFVHVSFNDTAIIQQLEFFMSRLKFLSDAKIILCSTMNEWLATIPNDQTNNPGIPSKSEISITKIFGRVEPNGGGQCLVSIRMNIDFDQNELSTTIYCINTLASSPISLPPTTKWNPVSEK